MTVDVTCERVMIAENILSESIFGDLVLDPIEFWYHVNEGLWKCRGRIPLLCSTTLISKQVPRIDRLGKMSHDRALQQWTWELGQC